MQTTTKTINYEILIRYHKDGTIGVHKQDIQIVKDGDNVITENILPAQPLTIIELKTIVADL